MMYSGSAANQEPSDTGASTTSETVASQATGVSTATATATAGTATTTTLLPTTRMINPYAQKTAATQKQQFMNQEQTFLPRDYIPDDSDVLCGRGAACWKHPGNTQYKNLVKQSALKYHAVSKKIDKSVIVASAIDHLRSTGALFLKRDSETNLWYDIGDEVARDKAGHAIRDCLKKILQRQSKPPKSNSAKKPAAASVIKKRTATAKGAASKRSSKRGPNAKPRIKVSTRVAPKRTARAPPKPKGARTTQSRHPASSRQRATAVSSTEGAQVPLTSLASQISLCTSSPQVNPPGVTDPVPVASDTVPKGMASATASASNGDMNGDARHFCVGDSHASIVDGSTEARFIQEYGVSKKAEIGVNFGMNRRMEIGTFMETRKLAHNSSLMRRIATDMVAAIGADEDFDAPKKAGSSDLCSSAYKSPALPGACGLGWLHSWEMEDEASGIAAAPLDPNLTSMDVEGTPAAISSPAPESESESGRGNQYLRATTVLDSMPIHELDEEDLDLSIPSCSHGV